MTLAQLVDLEAQLARDRDADPSALAERDRAALAGVALDPSRRGALLARWLDALRDREGRAASPGRAVAGALRGLRGALALGGLLVGWVAASGVMRWAGGHPVNVWDFLLAFVGVQVLLLAVLLATFFLPLAAAGAPAAGLARTVLGALVARLAARVDGGGSARAAQWRALWHRLRSRRSLYHAVEPWLLLTIGQTFGVAFNVGVLAAVLRLVVFTDVAFGWSTTLVELDPARFHDLARAVAWPWRALWPEAVPSPALVEATRYSHLDAAYALAGGGRSAHPELVGGWWRFLVAAVVAYGLAPRALLLALARLRAARLLARLPLRDAEVERVVARLTGPHVDARAPLGEARRELPSARDGAAAPERSGAPCALVLWRDVPCGPPLEAALATALRRPVVRVRRAGGRDHEEAGEDWAALGSGADVVVVAEAFEPPDRAVRRLLAELRRAVGATRLLRVLLVADADGAPRGPRDDEVRVWRDGLAPLEDPFLAVEPLPGRAP
jgi:hypothetical protein